MVFPELFSCILASHSLQNLRAARMFAVKSPCQRAWSDIDSIDGSPNEIGASACVQTVGGESYSTNLLTSYTLSSTIIHSESPLLCCSTSDFLICLDMLLYKGDRMVNAVDSFKVLTEQTPLGNQYFAGYAESGFRIPTNYRLLVRQRYKQTSK